MSAQPGEGATSRTMLVVPSLAIPSPAAAKPRRLALRVTLQVLLLGLLLATVLAVGGVDYLSSQLLTEEQTQQFLSATSLAVSSDVEAAFAPSVNALRQLQVQAEFDRLPLDDRLRLALVLADRLRYETAIDRLLWGDQA